MSWQAIAGASGYKVFRTQAGASPVLVTTTTALSVIDVGGTAGESYTYGVLPILPATSPARGASQDLMAPLRSALRRPSRPHPTC
ncbi:MAG: hypothetical protein AUG84_01820 [Chloroflexi bacterium 13_1_20CM_4_66_7]|nr:MAG: hypothetical protein AUG84_01820 [Chloroflexi bacterium 13_1_20CM_4_66_7]